MNGGVCLFGVFADVSLHQWARRKTMKSSFQSNPGPTVLGGFQTTRLSDSSHDNVLPCQRWRRANFLIRKFFVSDTGFEPGTPGPLPVSLTTVLPRPWNFGTRPTPHVNLAFHSLVSIWACFNLGPHKIFNECNKVPSSGVKGISFKKFFGLC